MELAKKLNVDYSINGADFENSFKFDSLERTKKINLGDIEIKILNTPGHTDGSLSFLINNEALICGDLLLLESPGRPDLARTKDQTIKGAGILFDTLQNVILKLDDNIKILPSHFTKTEIRPVVMSLGELKKSSQGISISNKDEFIESMTSNIPMTPPNYDSIKKYNKAGVIIPVEYAEELEIGPNRCAAR
jgi:glyoxylase-like metal-dependent hydrolase (beta-lactamase superfamily II)